MPYRPLKTNAATLPHVAEVIRSLEDHYLRDVHVMLRLPIPTCRLVAGCNFAIIQVLAAAIGGMSVTLYSQAGSKGARFKNLLVDFYPWASEPGNMVTPQDGADVIYSVIRNPLTHDLGLDLEKKARTPAVKIKRLTTKHKTRGLPEKDIEELERTDKRPRMSPTVTIRPDATVLLAEALYWGVRWMAERLAADRARMAAAQKFLATI